MRNNNHHPHHHHHHHHHHNNNNNQEDDTADGTMKPDITHRIYRIKLARTSTQMYSCSVACTILNACQYALSHMHDTEDTSLAYWPCYYFPLPTYSQVIRHYMIM